MTNQSRELVGNHIGPAEMPQTSRFMTDAEYRFVQNNVVIGCTDVLIVDPSTGEALSSFRQQKPQEGYWFSCGGRMKRGVGYQKNGAAKIKAELGLDVQGDRLELLTVYSTAFDERAQEPQEEGVHTSNAVVVLFVTPEERAGMGVQLNEEHERTDWVSFDDIETNTDLFPVVLRDATRRVERALFTDYLSATLATEGTRRAVQYIRESEGMPSAELEVPPGHVFFKIRTTSQPYMQDPFKTSFEAISAGGTVEAYRPVDQEGATGYQRDDGVLLAEGESAEIQSYLLGSPVRTLVINEDGAAKLIEATTLSQDTVDEAKRVNREHCDPYNGGLFRGEFLRRFRALMHIRREINQNEDHIVDREAVVAPYRTVTYSLDRKLVSAGFVDPSFAR